MGARLRSPSLPGSFSSAVDTPVRMQSSMTDHILINCGFVRRIDVGTAKKLPFGGSRHVSSQNEARCRIQFGRSSSTAGLELPTCGDF